MTSDPMAEEQEQVTADAAFERCDTHTFNGHPIVLTPKRMSAAAAAGMVFPFVPEEDRQKGTVMYRQMSTDIALLLFICATDDATVNRCFHGRTEVDSVRDMAFEWAGENGAQFNGPNYAEAANLFSLLHQEGSQSTGKPKFPKGEGTAPPN